MRHVLGVLGIVAVTVSVAWAADRIFTNPKPDAHLKKLFPQAVAFSPLEGTPLHFKAYAADPKTTPTARRSATRSGRRISCPTSAAITRPCTSSSAWTCQGVLTGVALDYDSEPYGYFSIQPPEFVAQFKGKSVRDAVPRRRGRRRGVARDHHDHQRRARHPRQLARHGQAVPDAGGGEAVMQPEPDPSAVAPTAQADPWGFEEEPVETFWDVLQPAGPRPGCCSPRSSPSPTSASGGRACR